MSSMPRTPRKCLYHKRNSNECRGRTASPVGYCCRTSSSVLKATLCTTYAAHFALSVSPFFSCRITRGFVSSGLCSSSSPAAALWFNIERYVCHPIAITPPNMLRYSMGTNANMNAVTAGHSLQLLIQETGTVFFIRSMVSGMVMPVSSDCMPKKYELNKGVKVSWLTATCKAG
jgi:hypothetical protein